jgi:hypothetical protein
MRHSTPDSSTEQPEHPWTSLETAQEVEGWMDLLNQEFQKILNQQPGHSQSVCFTLAHGGEIYLHTNSDGDVLLDVTPEAAWITPVICATTRATPPRGQIWLLPQDVLIDLILGLNSLIASSRLVLRHSFRLR